jgi:hypothetical protein
MLSVLGMRRRKVGSLIVTSRFACHFPRVRLEEVNGFECKEEELAVVNFRFCWIFIFDGETGKMIKIQEDLDAAVLRQSAQVSCG